MTQRPYKKKCPNCGKLRHFSGGRESSSRTGNWQWHNNLFVCPWCVDPARQRKFLAERRAERKAQRTKENMRKPMSFNEARDSITKLMADKDFKSDQERAIFLKGFRLGLPSGKSLNDDKEVETFIRAVNLHLELYGGK